MARYFEAGIGTAVHGEAFEMGKSAASEALSQLETFEPCLALAFISSELDIPEVDRGIIEALGNCPVIGTSAGGEIANAPLNRSVVVTVMASHHLRVRVGMGRGVRENYQGAVEEALRDAGIVDYFNSDHPIHQTLHMAAPKMPGVSPVLLIMFSPGATRTAPSLSHDIHTMLRKASDNHIPIFGGTSSDYFHFESNLQIVNSRVSDDAIALAFLESEILFGLGMAHGFTPTTKGALITKASGHIVHELDGRRASEVCSEILDIPSDELGEGALWFSRYPFGATDIYGDSILQVPECILDDGSIQFGPLMKKDLVITLMQAGEKDIVEAGLSAFEKALRHGGLERPSLAMVFSCALRKRLMGKNGSREIELIYENAHIPISGFYTFGEQGVSDDGLPIYGNQSVSTLVFSDELNPVAALIHKSKRIYQDFSSRLNRKALQIKGINRINQLIQEEKELDVLLKILMDELTQILSWAEVAFYLPVSKGNTYTVACASNLGAFPRHLLGDELKKQFISNWLDSHGERFGALVLKQRQEDSQPDEGDLELAETIGKLTAGALHKIKVDGRLDAKINQLDMLNQLGHELSKTISPSDQAKNIIRNIREILDLSMVSLWVVDQTHRLLVKEAIDSDPGRTVRGHENENDERVTKWQVRHCKPVFSTHQNRATCPVDLTYPFPYEFASLPIYYKGALRGILNLYATRQHLWSFQDDYLLENIEFLKTVSNQVGVFIENRSLHKNATFYKEIHHRVKNNLQNIASLLRMQMRRLDRITPERALDDSISRIMSIAAVHEILSHGEPGMVDLGRLLGRISKVSLPAQAVGPIITLDISGPSVTIPSRLATTVALVINELIQNALQHGIRDHSKGNVAIRVGQLSGFLAIIVHDNGPGLPKGFDMERDGNLGLTIVRTLVKDELKGKFLIHQEKGARAEISFPIPTYHVNI